MNDITTNDVNKFISYLQTQIYNRRTKSNGLSNATINRYLACLSGIFEQAVQENYIKENLMKKIKYLIEENKMINYLSKEQEEVLLKCLPDYIYKMVVIDLRTGLRLSNILNLNWEENIDMEEKYILIPKQDSKSKKTITIPMSKDVYDILLQTPKTSKYVSINPKTGKPYTTIYKGFKNACKKAGLPDNFRFHDLRHTVATRLVNSGVNLCNIQELLGHSTIKTTEKYLHPTKTAKMQMVDILDNYNKEGD